MKRVGNNATKCSELQGAIVGTDSRVAVGSINLTLDSDTAWALCNVLSESNVNKMGGSLEREQMPPLVNLGKAIGAIIDHPNRDFEHMKKES